jgi:ketosteroid isomerase-like protein
MYELTTATLQQWLASYKNAWETRDAEAAGRLFTQDATYRETPYAEPLRGRSAIRAYWTSVTADQRGIEFQFEIVATNGCVGVATWTASFTSTSTGGSVELDGVFVLEFDSDNLCCELREWWLLRPDDQ